MPVLLSAARKLLAAHSEKWHEHHRQLWRKFWERSWIRLSDPLLQDLWYMHQYLLACATRPGAIAPGLFSPWIVHDVTMWNNSYTNDYNFEQTFAAALSSNRPELLASVSGDDRAQRTGRARVGAGDFRGGRHRVRARVVPRRDARADARQPGVGGRDTVPRPAFLGVLRVHAGPGVSKSRAYPLVLNEMMLQSHNGVIRLFPVLDPYLKAEFHSNIHDWEGTRWGPNACPTLLEQSPSPYSNCIVPAEPG